jgi:hypothetical protein
VADPEALAAGLADALTAADVPPQWLLVGGKQLKKGGVGL